MDVKQMRKDGFVKKQVVILLIEILIPATNIW